MSIKWFLALTILTAGLTPAEAYIPRTQTIVSKMVSKNGRRQYKIVRDIEIQSPDQTVNAREEWFVVFGDKMKVHVSSLDPNNPWNFSILYGASDRKTLTQKKNLKSFKKSPDFVEPLFHDRSSKSLMKRLIAHRFLPNWIQEAEAPSFQGGKTKMTPEPFVSLDPMEGRVTYKIGASKNKSGNGNKTFLWVDQDSFLLRKILTRSKAEFINKDYQNYAGGLHLPSLQEIHWNDRSAKVKTLSAKVTKTKATDWDPKKLPSGNIPESKLVKEFYSRFR